MGPGQRSQEKGTLRRGRAQLRDKPCQGDSAWTCLDPCSPPGAGLGIAGLHGRWLLSQRSAPEVGHRPQEASLGLHAAHHPLLQAPSAGGTAWAEVSGRPAEERNRASGPWPGPQAGSGAGVGGWQVCLGESLPGPVLGPLSLQVPGHHAGTGSPALHLSRCPQAAPEPGDHCLKVPVGGCPSPAPNRDGSIPSPVLLPGGGPLPEPPRRGGHPPGAVSA